MQEKFAVQLYSVRNETKQDFPGVLRELSGQGWSGVEFAGFQGHDPERLAAVLQETGLRTAGMHVGVERLRTDLDGVLREAALLGTNLIICPSTPDRERSEPGYRALRTELNEMARAIVRRGFRLGYHNHAFEFQTQIDGRSALEFLLEPNPENHLLGQVDTYWLSKGGADPVAFVRPYAGRMPSIHVKDLGPDGEDAVVGAGLVDVPGILAWGERAGVEWYVTEIESVHNPLAKIQASLENLRRIAAQR